MRLKQLFFFLLLMVWACWLPAQISPGDLAEVHAHLEGISNCTKCHILGDKVTNEKCLQCHTELKSRLGIGKGYHASPPVKGKSCVNCHNDHHGRKFQIVRLEKEKFDHTLTGYKLQGAHAKKTCADCHKPALISSPTLKKKKFTYLGLSASCASCHEDYHQKTLSQNCEGCHGLDAFKPAPKFNHATAKFQLSGKHANVACEKCHKTGNRNGVKFQEFKGLQYKSCVNCHKDPHENQFGQLCNDCHTVESFRTVKGMNKFDHTRTGFLLEGKHAAVNCKSCHKARFTDPLKHQNCYDCHTDYHSSQFVRNGVRPDCSSCHSTNGFKGSSYTLEKHDSGAFPLRGAHAATACTDCHKKTDKWSFRNIGLKCADCHANIHETSMSDKYTQEAGCASCHDPVNWNRVRFEHTVTGYELKGPHSGLSCRSCHYPKNKEGMEIQKFKGLDTQCSNCHADNHHRQFETEGKTDCLRCHSDDSWKISNFDHNRTSFRLDGKHAAVTCSGCHKPVNDAGVVYILYKIKDTRCESCH